MLADAFEFGQTAGQFELVFDIGLYHYLRHTDLDRFVNLLWRVTQPGSYYFTVAARKHEPAPEGGPPQVSQKQNPTRVGRLFEVVQVRMCRLASPHLKGGYPAWSCLMHRPVAAKPAV